MVVVAGTGILKIVTPRAVTEIEAKLLNNSLRTRLHLDLNDYWKVFSFRESLVRDQCVSFLGKAQDSGL